MKKTLRSITILVFPFLLMAVVNELVRPSIKSKTYRHLGIITMNSNEIIKDKCTWNCHNKTAYCKINHVKFNKKYFAITDTLYFGLIGSLKKADYVSANIIFLVVFMPFFIWYFLIKSLNIQDEINKIKKR